MKNKSRPASASRQRRRGGAPESASSRETFPKRTKKPGSVGLANEARPGLGTRAKPAAPGVRPSNRPAPKTTGKPRVTRRSYEEPRPAPREQAPNTFAHELERSTATSGQSGLG